MTIFAMFSNQSFLGMELLGGFLLQIKLDDHSAFVTNHMDPYARLKS